jgi:predicted O-linked N-acetylglucosamine transferase (SPINDLY family)
MAGLFEGHDRNRFELFAFDNGFDDGTAMRRRVEKAFGSFIDISRLSDLEAAKLIRDRQIDILVNLNGYCGLSRTGVFAHKACPVQVNYLGFPGTIGAEYIDYIVADKVVITGDEERYYSEKVVSLPDSYQVNDSRRANAEGTPTRAEAGLPETGFVFCCFNNNHKLTPELFDLWMRLLAKVEGSTLWLIEDNGAVAGNLRREAERRGVAPERLVFAPRVNLDAHLARHRLADLFLDTLPYNAHTTASDALWAGLPVLTCMGSAFPGRVAASLLYAADLPELVTKTLEEYEALALRLATNPSARRAQNQAGGEQRDLPLSTPTDSAGTSSRRTPPCGSGPSAGNRRLRLRYRPEVSASVLVFSLQHEGKTGRPAPPDRAGAFHLRLEFSESGLCGVSALGPRSRRNRLDRRRRTRGARRARGADREGRCGSSRRRFRRILR